MLEKKDKHQLLIIYLLMSTSWSRNAGEGKITNARGSVVKGTVGHEISQTHMFSFYFYKST